MQTRTRVHSPQERQFFRQEAEHRAQRCAVQLVACVSMLRWGAAYLLPRTGAAGWWALLLCALPALAVYALAALSMRRAKAATLSDALGVWGGRVLRAAAAACLSLEGTAAMTTLVTLLDEGVGVAVSPLPLAFGTAAVLCGCLVREGIPRGVQLLGWLLLAMAVAIAADLLAQARADHLFPLQGMGMTHTLRTALPCGSAAWALILLLETPAPRTGRRTRGWCVPLCAVALLLAATLAVPHEILTAVPGMADSLLMPGAFLSPLNRTLLLCLWILLLALCCVVCADGAARAAGAASPWAGALLLAVFAGVQAWGAERVAAALRSVQMWQLAPFALLAAVSFIRKGRTT